MAAKEQFSLWNLPIIFNKYRSLLIWYFYGTLQAISEKWDFLQNSTKNKVVNNIQKITTIWYIVEYLIMRIAGFFIVVTSKNWYVWKNDRQVLHFQVNSFFPPKDKSFLFYSKLIRKVFQQTHNNSRIICSKVSGLSSNKMHFAHFLGMRPIASVVKNSFNIKWSIITW